MINALYCRTIRNWLPVAAILVLLPFACANGTTYYVRADGNDGNDGLTWATARQTPSGGVAAATSHGDEVILSNGVYTLGGMLTLTRGITFRSLANDPAAVVLDGGAATVAFTVNSTATNALIASITISNTVNTVPSAYGGGIIIAGALNATVSNCLFTRCSATNAGAIYMSAGTVVDSTFTTNTSNQGAGIYVRNAVGTSRIERCIFSNNINRTAFGVSVMLYQNGGKRVEIMDSTFVTNSGGPVIENNDGSTKLLLNRCEFLNNTGRGLYNYMGEAVVSNCTFIGNKGGAYSGATNSVFSGCVFASNTLTGGTGAGLNMAGGMVDRCVFRYNYCLQGGGLYITGPCTVRNSLFVGNQTSGSYGGAIMVFANTDMMRIENCTITGNKSPSLGGGICFYWNSGSPVIAVTNTICVFNSGSTVNSNYYGDLGGTWSFGNSCTMPVPSGGGFVNNGGNTASNPLFKTDGSGYGTNHIMGDYAIQKASPCRNTGFNTDWMPGTLDLAGKGRIDSSIVDMGAYEFKLPAGGMLILK